MQVTKFQPKKIAPIQYLLRQLNSEAGLVAPGWGTTLLMSILMFLFFCFLLIIFQIANGSILLEGVNVDWSSLNQVPPAETATTAEQSFASTAIGVFSGLLVFVIGCIAFIAYGASTYPSNKA